MLEINHGFIVFPCQCTYPKYRIWSRTLFIQQYSSLLEYVDFWFDSIHCHRTADERSNDGHFDPPILLVFTGKDKYSKVT